MKKKNVLFKALLFIVCFTLSLGSSSKTNSNVNSSEELKAGQQFFILQGYNQSPEKISSFACLENNIFQFQVKNISATLLGGTHDINFGKITAIPGRDADAVWVSPL